jgi:hypothetical protein
MKDLSRYIPTFLSLAGIELFELRSEVGDAVDPAAF